MPVARLPRIVSCAVVLTGAIGIALAREFAAGLLLGKAIFVLCAAFLAGFGLHAIRDPTSLRFDDNDGTDAFGMARYGNSRQATSSQGTTTGVVCLTIAVLLLVVGVLLGAIARGVGIPTS